MQKSINKDFLLLTKISLENYKFPNFKDIEFDFKKTVKKHFDQNSHIIEPISLLKFYFDSIKETVQSFFTQLPANNIFSEINVRTDQILTLWLANFGPTYYVSYDVFLFSIAKVCYKTKDIDQVIMVKDRLHEVIQVFKSFKKTFEDPTDFIINVKKDTKLISIVLSISSYGNITDIYQTHPIIPYYDDMKLNLL